MRKNEIVAIILGGGTNALAQIRAAQKAGYYCINIVEKGIHSYSRKSRYCKGILAPHPFNKKKECINLLLNVIKELNQKPYIFFASDEWLNLVGDNDDLFRKVSIIPQSEWEYLSQFYNKKYLYRIAEEFNIPHPKTIEIESLKKLDSAIDSIQKPYIIKPQSTISQNQLKGSGIIAYHRTQRFETKQQLKKWISLLISKGIDYPVLLQEFIPGDPTTLYTLTSYSAKDGSLLAGSVGHKIRQFPPIAGRITAGILKHNMELFKLGKKFLKDIGYYGLANTEFKYDERDHTFKLMEINTRLGAWNYSVLYSGLNLIEIAVNDTIGIKYNGPMYRIEKDGKIWYNLAMDCFSSIYMNKKIGQSEHQLSFRQWRNSVKKNGFEAVWDKKDPFPFIYSFIVLCKGFLRN